ncbi:MAG: tetratricopeptide repeat protein [Rhodanobacter sp.]
MKDAEALFRFETQLYPLSWNAFDSLAETLASLGKKADAKRAYRRAYALNPKDIAALDAVHALP